MYKYFYFNLKEVILNHTNKRKVKIEKSTKMFDNNVKYDMVKSSSDATSKGEIINSDSKLNESFEEDGAQYNCELCDFQSGNERRMMRHTLRKHTKSKVITCETCGEELKKIVNSTFI